MMPIIHKFDHFDHHVTRQELHDIACAYVESEFARKGEVDITWLLASGPHLAWVKTLWENETEKNVSLEFVRGMIEKIGCTCYAQVNEAWIARQTIDMDAGDKLLVEAARREGLNTLPPRLRDDIAFVNSHDAESSAISRYLVTIRKPKGLNFIGPRDDQNDAARMAGRMWNLLQPEVDTAEFDEKAKKAGII